MRAASGFTFACARVIGTPERPRLCVYRSNGNIYAQVVDDRSGRTLASASSIDKDTRKELKGGSNVAAAKVIGEKIAERTRAAGIEQVVFDRGGYMYHGRVEALAAAKIGRLSSSQVLWSLYIGKAWQIRLRTSVRRQ